MKRMRASLPGSILIPLFLAACSPGSNGPADKTDERQPVASALRNASSSQAKMVTPQNSASPSSANAQILGLEGLGDLRIGEPVAINSRWKERGAGTGSSCRVVTSPDYRGVYAIVEDGRVRRITLGQRSDVKLAEGLGVGATEAEVRKWFAGFRVEPHKYEDAPAKYLTAPNATNGSSALRFEIGRDGRVSLIHVGLMPALAYVEGCG